MPSLPLHAGSCALAAALVLAASAVAPAAPGWRAGVAVVDVTPGEPVWLAGYAARSKPSQGVATPIQVEALALEDASGERLLAVTCDLVGVPRTLADPFARWAAARWALPRARVLACATHSHSAPVIEDALLPMYRLEPEWRQRAARMTERVETAFREAAERAMEGLRPAEVAVGTGTCGFAKNRRMVTPEDPVDHDVPVLVVDFAGADRATPDTADRNGDAQEGDGAGRGNGDAPGNATARRAVLFAYACHCTTLSGPLVGGDWAGVAKRELEARHDGLVALFAAGCAGDQNPLPRRRMELCEKYGRMMAGAVGEVMDGTLRPLEPVTRAAFGRLDLPLVDAPSREAIERDLEAESPWVRIRARRLLERLDAEGRLPGSYPLAAQVWRLGDHRLVALAGEATVEYALRLKEEVPAAAGGGTAAVIAYANDCPGYIPSEKVLREGGYEGETSMIYYGLHGPWAPGVEKRVVDHVLRLMRAAERPGPRRAVDSAVVRVFGAGEFTEGPAEGPGGAVWFSDIPNDRILRLERGNVFVARRPSGKANGLAFDREGRLLACEGADGGNRRVTRTEADGSITVLAAEHEGKRLNSPNDLAVDPEGRVYFSDPRYTGDEPRELEVEGVYRIDAPGHVVRVIDDCEKPNGLDVSPDGTVLYVSDAGASRLLAYRIGPGGDLSDRREVFRFEGRGVDGMETDAAGNIWAAAGRGERTGVWVISPEGELLDFVHLPANATNVCFAGEDGRTVYATAGGSLYRLRAAPEAAAR